MRNSDSERALVPDELRTAGIANLHDAVSRISTDTTIDTRQIAETLPVF
jgi:hypothetical protein